MLLFLAEELHTSRCKGNRSIAVLLHWILCCLNCSFVSFDVSNVHIQIPFFSALLPLLSIVYWSAHYLTCDDLIYPVIPTLSTNLSQHTNADTFTCSAVYWIRNMKIYFFASYIILKPIHKCFHNNSLSNAICDRPWGLIGLWDVEDPTLYRHSAHRCE
jgi:hypothetical protein